MRRETRSVLAFYPMTAGYAFVLFEAPLAPLDWGTRQVRGERKNARTLSGLKRLLERYCPEVLAIEDTRQGKRSERIKRLHRMILQLAQTENLTVFTYTKLEVRSLFAETGAIKKPEIAEIIASLIPAFAHRLPPKRKCWMGEDPRQNLFDAAALGLTFYAREDAESEEPGGWDVRHELERRSPRTVISSPDEWETA